MSIITNHNQTLTPEEAQLANINNARPSPVTLLVLHERWPTPSSESLIAFE
jgi:hypothetical protein